MTEQIKVIIDKVVQTNQENFSDWFVEGDLLTLEAPDVSGEIEIDAFLNVEINNQIKVIDVGDNLLDTERLFYIPVEFRDSSFRKRFVFLPSENLRIIGKVFTVNTKEAVVEKIVKQNNSIIKNSQNCCSLSLANLGIIDLEKGIYPQDFSEDTNIFLQFFYFTQT